MKEVPLKWRIAIILLILVLFIVCIILSRETPENSPQDISDGILTMVEANTLKAYPVSYTLKPQIYHSIVDCLAWHESKYSPYAMGKDGECGILQFKKGTFQMYCVDKYGLRNNIWDSDIQRRCADLMLQDNWRNIYHWSVADKCLY